MPIHPNGVAMQWKDVVGFEGIYKVSDTGKVKSLPKTVAIGSNYRFIADRIMKLRTTEFGYKTVKLSNKHIVKLCQVHQLVLNAFVGPCPKGKQCRHLDGNPSNNNINNICWGTAKQNSQDRIRHGTQAQGESVGNAKLDNVDIPKAQRLYKSGKSFRQLAKIFNVSHVAIRLAVVGHTFKHNQPKNKIKVRPPGFQKGNRANGKLTPESMKDIQKSFDGGESYTSIAKRHCVSYTTVWSFINKKSYR